MYFDFRTPPWMYSSESAAGPDASKAPQSLPYPTGDVRAMRLLECLSFINPEGHNVPGQINVNTAPAEVLSMVPILNEHPAWDRAVLAYRWRTTFRDLRIPEYYRSGSFDFTDSVGADARYPGYGIRSLGELEIPLSALFGAATLNGAKPSGPMCSTFARCAATRLWSTRTWRRSSRTPLPRGVRQFPNLVSDRSQLRQR